MTWIGRRSLNALCGTHLFQVPAKSVENPLTWKIWRALTVPEPVERQMFMHLEKLEGRRDILPCEKTRVLHTKIKTV